jgi:hypothetical protein
MFGLRWFGENRDFPALARDHGIAPRRLTGHHLGTDLSGPT